MSYTPYSEFDEDDFGGNDVLTMTITTHEYRNLLLKIARIEGFMRGVLGMIDELRVCDVSETTLVECMDKKIRELFENDSNDRKGNDNA